MRQKVEENDKSNAFIQNLEIVQPRTIVYIKQEVEENKESLKCALYSSVKTKSSSEINEEETYNRSKHCSLCNITFKCKNRYEEHSLHSHKTKKKPIVDLKTLCCNICNKSFKISLAYRQHMLDLNNINILLIKPKPLKNLITKYSNNYCESCNRTFKVPKSLYNHLIKVHNISHENAAKELCKPKITKPTIDLLNHYCDVCRKGYENKGNYIRHLSHFHSVVYSELDSFDKKTRYCKVCDIKFNTQRYFISHLRTVHRTELTSDVTVPMEITSDVTIPTDSSDRKKYCFPCNTIFHRPNALLHHQICFHLDENPELLQGIDYKIPRKGSPTYNRYCIDCLKLFRSKSLYQIHLDKIHGIKPLESLKKANDSDVNYCRLCDKTFSDRCIFQRHMVDIHRVLFPTHKITNDATPIVDSLKKYCNVCDRTYKNLGSYRDHLSRYHDIKFNLPGKYLNGAVNRKEVPVIDERGNHCTACDKTYKNRASYKGHLLVIHRIKLPSWNYKRPRYNRDAIPNLSNENNYCTLCKRTYANRSNFRVHLNTIHEIKKEDILI